MLSSLKDWRELQVGGPACAAWEQFKPFFAQHGYRLFVLDLDLEHCTRLKAPEECSSIRAEDPNSRFLPESLNMGQPPSYFYPQTGVHFAARSPNNADVVIRIMAIGDDGQEHLNIMRALAAPDARVPENRTVPMIAELNKDNFVFGVFPLMWSRAMSNPWFETVRQVLDALDQALEGFTFLHDQLIAHRDFAMHEVFSNYGRGWDPTKRQPPCLYEPPVFRSCCPGLRYMINDLELSVQFAPDSPRGARVVTGMPIARYGYSAEEYCKPLAPEAIFDAPYCPFKADIYQFGASALYEFGNVQIAELRALFEAMTSKDPAARPTAAQALEKLRKIRQTTPEDVLDAIPLDDCGQYRRLAPDETCSCCVRTSPRKVLAPYNLNRVSDHKGYAS